MKENDYTGFTDYLLAEGYSSTTTEQYCIDVRRFEKWTAKENLTPETISYNDILHYMQYKRKTVNQQSISHIVNSLKHYFNYLRSLEIVNENPAAHITVKGIRRKKLYDILSKQELETLYHSYEIKEDKQNENQNWYKASQLGQKRNKVIIGLMIYQGLNATDLGRLTVKDVKLREGKIFIPGTRKSNERELKLESVQILDLMEYTLKTRDELLQLSGKTSDQFLVSTGKSNNIHNVLSRIIKQLQQTNPKVSSLKQIRTSVITHWLKTHNLRETQYMAGHRYVSSTESYLVNDMEGLQEDITKFHPIG